MNQVVVISTLVAGAILAALALAIGMAGAVNLTRGRSHGYLHVIFYAMLLMVALANVLSGRDLTTIALSFEMPAAPIRHAVMVVMQPLASALMLMVAGERIISYWLKRDKATPVLPGLALTFILFWAGTVAAPALLGAHPYFSHDYVYPLVIGVAAVLATNTEWELAVRATRNAIMLFMVAGLLLIPIEPGLVLDNSYTQGLLPGVPRLAGLAEHAVTMGLLAQLGLLCLMARPCRRAWFNRLAWATGLGVLFLAQSKAAWISFGICATCIVVVRGSSSFWRRASDPMRPEVGVLSLVLFMAGLLAVALLLMFGDLDSKLSSFFSSAEGAQLASLTGRDKIWAIAYEEWQRNPVFGYGPTLWDVSFRLSIGMPNATHAHNQFMDTLSRSGTVGAVTFVFYALVLLVMSVRYARTSGGLTLALFVALALRSISEVPLYLGGYGAEFIIQVLLLISLAAAANEARVRKFQTSATARTRAPLAPARNPLVASAGVNQ